MNYWDENYTQNATLEVKADKRFYKHDIMGTIAHITMLSEQGYISQSDSEVIQKALTQIFYDITEEKLSLTGVSNVFAFLDEELSGRIGELSSKVNIARTTNERLLLDARMYAKELSNELIEKLEQLILTALNIAENQTTTFINSETFGYPSQPTTIAHTVCAHIESFVRDINLFNSAISSSSVMPLYSGYGTGIRMNVDKKRVASLLGFNEVAQNTLDGINDTSFINSLNFAITETAKDISSFAKSLYGWLKSGIISLSSLSVSPVSYGRLTFDTLSEITSKTAICISAQSTANIIELTSTSANILDIISTMFESQNAIECIFDDIFSTLEKVAFNEQTALKEATANYTTAIDCVNYLVSKGENLSTAYEIVGKICEYCEINNKRLDTIAFEVYEQFSPLFENDIIPAMRVKNAVRLRKNVGEPSDVSVRAEIRAIKRKLNKLLPSEQE